MSEEFTHRSLLGAKLGAYAIRDLLDGEGAGAIWRAEDAHGTPWTVKVFQPAPWVAENDEELRARFDLLRAIPHPNLIELKELLRLDDGRVAVVMEHLYGQDLAQQLAVRKRLPVDELLAILSQSLSGLERLHQGLGGEGIILNGLTPRRIFRQDNGTVKLLTFDAGRFSPSPEQAQAAIAAWLSPEQVQGYPPDLRADLYSLGAVAYAGLCGAPPFTGETLEEVAAAQLRARSTPPMAPSRRAPAGEVSDRLDAVTLKALAIDPDERYASAFEMSRAVTRLQSRSAAAGAAPRRQARSRPTILILGGSGAGKTTWLAMLYRELTGRQGRLCADVRGPEDRDYLEAQLALLREGKSPPPTANEQPRRLEFSLTRRGSPIGPIVLVDYAGRLAENITPEHPGPLPDLLQPTDGLVLLLDPQRLAQPEARRETLRKLRVAVDAIVERQQPSGVAKGRSGKLAMPVALVLGKADLLTSDPELAKARSAIRGAVQTLRDDLRPYFTQLRIFELSCPSGKTAGKEPGAIVKPLAYALEAMRPTALRRARPKLLKLGAAICLIMAVLVCWAALNFYRIQTQGYAILEAAQADPEFPLEQRIGQLDKLVEREGGRFLLFTRRMLYRSLGERLVKPYEATQQVEEEALRQVYDSASAQPGGYPESAWRTRWMAYDRRWRLQTGEATIVLLSLWRTMEQESNLEWCLERQQERYAALAQDDAKLQLAYLDAVTTPALGVITAPATIEEFQRRRPWSEVRGKVIALFEQAGALAECRRLVNAHLDLYTRAAIPPAEEATAWQEGFNLIVETRGVIEQLELKRDFARAVQVFDELQPRTAQLPREALKGLAAIYETHQAWQALDLTSLDLGRDAERQTAHDRIAEFLSDYPADTLSGVLADDAPKLLLLISDSLKKPSRGLEGFRLQLDTHQLTATPLAWKLLLDIAWSEHVRAGASIIRQTVTELSSSRRTTIANAAVERLPRLIDDCRDYQRWDQERFDFLDKQSAPMINPLRERYCQNLTEHADDWLKRPAIIGSIDVSVEKSRRFALEIHQQANSVKLDPDENPWSKEPFKFILPVAAVDWSEPLRLEAAVEVDYLFNKTYRAKIEFSPAGPLVMLLFDRREYVLVFTSGSETIPGMISFGENFTLPYLLDPERSLF